MTLRDWRTFRGQSHPLAKHGPAIGNYVISVLAVLVFVATFRGGIDRGMDHLVSWEAYGRVLNAVSAVFTRERHHLYGYVLSNCIYQELSDRGFNPDPAISAKYGFAPGQNLKSASFLDTVLDSTWRDLRNIPECTGNFRGFGADDVGYADFVQGAFYLFGHHVRALYYFYFVLYGATLFTALYERRGDYVGQILILATSALVFAAFYSSDLYQNEPSGSGNMLNPRLMTILGIVPGVHLLLMGVSRAPARLGRILAVVFQSMLVFFVIHIRATGVWLEGLLALAVLFLVTADLFRREGRRPFGKAVGTALAARWPIIVGVALVFAGNQAVSFSLNYLYEKDGWLQHHALWHSIYYSLQFHPDYQKKYGAMHRGMGGDAMPIGGALAYLDRHPEENTPEIWLAPPDPNTGYVGTLKYAEMERLVRLAFFEFMKRDPQMVYDVFVLKLQWTLRNVLEETEYEWNHSRRSHRIILILALVGGGLLSSYRSERLRNIAELTVVTAAAAVASLLIPVLTLPYPKSVMMEEIMAAQVAVLLLFALIVGCLARWLAAAERHAARVWRPLSG